MQEQLLHQVPNVPEFQFLCHVFQAMETQTLYH